MGFMILGRLCICTSIDSLCIALELSLLDYHMYSLFINSNTSIGYRKMQFELYNLVS